MHRSALTSGDGGMDGDGGSSSPFAGGSGASTAPYEIDSCSALQAMELDLDAHYRLVANIDCGGFDPGDGLGFRPVGTESDPFTGTFLGSAHTIKDLQIDRENDEYVGLFGYAEGASLERFGLVDTDIKGKDYVGKVAGFASDSILELVYALGNIQGRYYVGGIAGATNGGSLSSSYQRGDVSCQDELCGILIGFAADTPIEQAYGVGRVDLSPPNLFNPESSVVLEAGLFDCEVAEECGVPNGAESSDLKDPVYLDGAGFNLNDVWGERATAPDYLCLFWESGCVSPVMCGASDTTCDGVDDDCDGGVDEGYLAIATNCGAGSCASTGTTSCVGGTVQDSCLPGTPSGDDAVCDGSDTDCDGLVDEGFVSAPSACGQGACAATGTLSCVDGAQIDSCVPGAPGSDDVSCNAVDNDCDGLFDEDYVSSPTTCGIGGCLRSGAVICSAGWPQNTCVPGTPAGDDATCDTIDDDCDGLIDEDCSFEPTCADFRATCGTISDGRGGTLDCGSCSFPEVCGGGGVPNVCGVSVLPPDPATVAPPAPNGVGQTLAGALDFFDEGTNPIQQGAVPNAIETHRAAGIRGSVVDEAGDPLPGVRVHVHGHPEFGWTFTRADGVFDLVVNGGSDLVISYEKDNYLPIQRRVNLGWGAYGVAPNVALTPIANVATHIAFGSSSGQVATGPVESDSDGARQATVYFPAGVTAVVEGGGTTTPLSTGRLRMTEFTVGERGGLAMPGTLPGASRYTYAVDISIDQAGPDSSVRLSEPVSLYVDNFLNLPVGYLMPLGSYSRELADWVPEKDGFIAEVTGTSGPMADIDLDGDGSPENPTVLALWGIDGAEREVIAARFAVGETFWRVQTEHFTPFDCNMTGRRRSPPDPPIPPEPERNEPEEADCASGSVIHCQTQTLGETIPVSATGFDLNYQSDRIRANTLDEHTVILDISGYGGSPEAIGTLVIAEVLGRRLVEQVFPPGTPEVVIEWDGLDAFGRQWNGPAELRVVVDSTAPSQYELIPTPILGGGPENFGKLGASCEPGTDPCCVSAGGGGQVIAGRLQPITAQPSSVYQKYHTYVLGAPVAETLGLGGFYPSNYHRYVPLTGELVLGSGTSLKVREADAVTTIVAGAGSNGVADPGSISGSAREADLHNPIAMAVGPSGTLYFVQERRVNFLTSTELWSVTPDGELVPVLVSDTVSPEIWPAWEAAISALGRTADSVGGPQNSWLGVDADENVYFVLQNPYNRIFRIRNQGKPDVSVELVAGPSIDPASVEWADGTPVVGPGVLRLLSFSVQPNGQVWFVNQRQVSGGTGFSSEIVEVTPNGTGRVRYTTPVGASFFGPLQTSADGTIYVIENLSGGGQGVREILPDETTRLLLGEGTSTGSPWEQMADDIRFNAIDHIAVAADGDLFFSLGGLGELGRLRAGFVERIGFGGLAPPPASTITATEPGPWGGIARRVVPSPDGSVYIAEAGTHRIIRRRFGSRPQFEEGFRIASEDASQLYYFDATGRHLRTTDPMTSVDIWSFEHDSEGRLVSASDADGEVTRFQRPNASTVVIEAPGGSSGTPITTTLALDTDGYIDTITDPEGAVWAFDYDPNGLLRRMWRPRQNLPTVRAGVPSTFDYERTDGPREQARLVRDADPTGRTQTLSSSHFRGTQTPRTGTWCDGSTYIRGYQISNIETTVSRTTTTGQTYTYTSTRATPSSPMSMTVTAPNGRSHSRSERTSDNTMSRAWPGGRITVHDTADPVVGGDGRYINLANATVDATATRPELQLEVTSVRTATVGATNGVVLGDVQSWREDTTVNGTDTSTMEYDGVTRTLRETSAEGRVTETVLDVVGRPVEIRVPGQVPTTFTYDPTGRLTSIQRSNGTETRRVDYGFDPNGYLSSVEAPTSASDLLRVAYPDNNLRGSARQVDRQGAGTVLFDLDVEGHVERLTPPGRPGHEFDRSDTALPTAYRPPGVVVSVPGSCPAGATCVSYDAHHRVSSTTRPDGQVMTPTYSVSTGQLLNVQASGEGTWSLAYDSNGRVTRATANDGGFIDYEHQADLPVATEWGGTHTLLRGSSPAWSGTINGRVEAFHNDYFRIEALEVQGGHRAEYIYDRDGLVTEVRASTGSPVPALSFGRSPVDGHLESTTLGLVEIERELDIGTSTPGFGDLEGMVVRTGPSTTVYEVDYLRDRAGRITEKTEVLLGATETRRYEYDSAGRLHIVRNQLGTLLSEYRYDDQGNRTYAHTSSGTVSLGTNLGCPDSAGMPLAEPSNDQDQLCRYGNYNYTYDANGRLESKAHVTDSLDVTTYDYAGDGRLRRVELPTGRIIDYVHDAQGRRIGRVVDGVFDKGWLYKDSINPVAQLDSTGTVEATFVYATRPHVPDFMVRNTGEVYRFVTDNLGSVRLVINVATGATVERMTYDEWGNVTSSLGAFSTQPFGYAGGLHDIDTGLIQFNARDYDPVTGRWTAKDPAGFGGGDSNLYAYVGNEPVNHLDPLGRFSITDVDISEDSALVRTANFLNGFADHITRQWWAPDGLVRPILDAGGVSDIIDECSDAYSLGTIAGAIAEMVFTMGIASAATGSSSASRAGGSALDETVELFHHTSTKGGQGINQSGVLRGSSGVGLWRPWRTGDVYLTTHAELGPIRRLVYGLTKSKTAFVVRVRLPKSLVERGPFGIRIHRGDIRLGPPQSF
ncbi:MAG: RHS repeat-associated core domain-containing protein [Myxococcota bacterium]